MNHKDTKTQSNELSEELIGVGIEVHRLLGPGLLESAYEEAFCHELSFRKIPFERQKPVPVLYKDIKLHCGYRLDLLVDRLVIVEIKSVHRIERVHEAQLLTYLKLFDLWLGLLLNFNVSVLRNGIKRIVNG
jgi:GxxExxY protein